MFVGSASRSVCLAALAVVAFADIREVGPLWGASRERPEAAAIPPGADRSQFAVISSYPVAIVDRAQSGPRDRRVAATVRTIERREFTPTARDASADPVLERYPGILDLWSPFTEDPAAFARHRNSKKPLFVPNTGFLLEH
ncbi:hypothetical protein GE061_005940 [Apolygus lucorum]|uniref:Uncharacterized protein n=1 Tax=Apolygus lucorum TaxID=248454 RepID=A0A6A4J6D5_APOLU|nr:hypothetical protein GE061_005940 [Apolygus lucorum]